MSVEPEGFNAIQDGQGMVYGWVAEHVEPNPIEMTALASIWRTPLFIATGQEVMEWVPRWVCEEIPSGSARLKLNS